MQNTTRIGIILCISLAFFVAEITCTLSAYSCRVHVLSELAGVV